jgi:hypothetical protein
MARWNGWWEQRGYGRQEMRDLDFAIDSEGQVSGRGHDCVGLFTFTGSVAPEVVLVKQYVGQHAVLYVGTNTGEGIFGTWQIPHAPLCPGITAGRFALYPAKEGSADVLAVRELQPAARD